VLIVNADTVKVCTKNDFDNAIGTTSQIIYINSDGSITPQTAKIRHDGDKYTFSDNVHDPIGILRDNAIIDSAGYTHQGP